MATYRVESSPLRLFSLRAIDETKQNKTKVGCRDMKQIHGSQNTKKMFSSKALNIKKPSTVVLATLVLVVPQNGCKIDSQWWVWGSEFHWEENLAYIYHSSCCFQKQLGITVINKALFQDESLYFGPMAKPLGWDRKTYLEKEIQVRIFLNKTLTGYFKNVHHFSVKTTKVSPRFNAAYGTHGTLQILA